jgi:hypothetical protein
MGRLSIVELSIIFTIVFLLVHGPAIHDRLGLRTLSARRGPDIFIGLGIVVAFLATFLILTQS